MNIDDLVGKVLVPGQYITPLFAEGDGKVTTFVSGRGTTVNNIEHGKNIIQVILASILGKLFIQKEEKEEGDQITVSVISTKLLKELDGQHHLDLGPVSNNLPKENDVVLVKITKINQKQAFCEILSVEGQGNIIEDPGLGLNGEIAHTSLGVGGGSQALNNQSTIASSLTTSVNAMATELGESFKGLIRSQDVRSTERDKVKIIESFKPGDVVRAIIISLGDGSNYYLSTARNDLGVIYAKSENGAGFPMFPIDWEHMVCPKLGVLEKRKCAQPVI